MDLGTPEAVLELNCVVFVCISTVLLILFKKHIINVRGSNSFEIKTEDICISNSAGEKH